MNKLVSMCDLMNSVESIWSQDGNPNLSQYYWRLAWYKVRGVVLVATAKALVGSAPSRSH